MEPLKLLEVQSKNPEIARIPNLVANRPVNWFTRGESSWSGITAYKSSGTSPASELKPARGSTPCPSSSLSRPGSHPQVSYKLVDGGRGADDAAGGVAGRIHGLDGVVPGKDGDFAGEPVEAEVEDSELAEKKSAGRGPDSRLRKRLRWVREVNLPSDGRQRRTGGPETITWTRFAYHKHPKERKLILRILPH
ncbi:hypothetical protein NL676_019525 [Syzygium grande]|nr:hypothetical protein NL676_019525 [Syzygium grande]